MRDFRELEEPPPPDAAGRDDSDCSVVLELDAAAVEVLPDRDLKWNTIRSACFFREVILERCRRPRCSEITPFAPPVALDPSSTSSNCNQRTMKDSGSRLGQR